MSGQHPGALWRRVDLQCHTPRDAGWTGSDGIPAADAAGLSARDAWADAFMAAAREKGLSIVAVTDHHDVAMLPHVVGAGRRAGVLVLPGVEVTCRDSVQVLAIFEPSTQAEDWMRFLGKLPSVRVTDHSLARVGPLTECGLTVAELFKAVAEDVTLAPVTMLLPHFGSPTAYKSLNEPPTENHLNVTGHASRARDLPHDAVYIECEHGSLDGATLDKIQGRIADWGTRRRAIVATGDSKRPTFERLGAHECWIKIGEETLEGFRQAFLADEARVAYGAPERPSEHIVGIEIKSKLTGPEPVGISFNDGFNAFIGGRGSGKSAILEYLRFGLGKSEEDLEQDDLKPRKPRAREAELIADTLGDGHVIVSLERNGVAETWTRHGSKPEEILLTIAGDEERMTVQEAQRRFPARAFAQKELSTTMLDPEVAADNITGIASAEAIQERRRIDGEMNEAKRAVAKALIEAAAYWQARLDLTQADHTVSDVRRRQAALAEQMASGGVTPDDMKTIADAQAFDRAAKYLDDVDARVSADRQRVTALKDSILTMAASTPPDVADFPELGPVVAGVQAAQAGARGFLDRAVALLDGVDATSVEARVSFDTSRSFFNERYEAAKLRQAAHGALIAENEKLDGQMRAATATQSKAAQTELDRREALAGLEAAVAKLRDLIEARRAVLKGSAERIAEKSAGSLKAKVERDRNPADANAALCALFEGSRFRDTEAHCEEWVRAVFAPDDAGWPALCAGLLDAYRDKILAGNPSEPGAEAATQLRGILFGGRVALTAQQLARVYANLTDQTLAQVFAATPRDRIVMTYVAGRQSIPFAKASPGQQASALLRLLLGQSAGTLIVDQPEDDLDNKVMMEIVRLIRSSKGHRQILFATHNPNLVVNGDADKVVVMRATVAEDRPGAEDARINVETDGAIETPAIREAITTIMEGGLDAFDLRARKYGIEGAGPRNSP